MVVLEAIGAVVERVHIAMAVRAPDATDVGMWSALSRFSVGRWMVEFGRFWRERFDISFLERSKDFDELRLGSRVGSSWRKRPNLLEGGNGLKARQRAPKSSIFSLRRCVDGCAVYLVDLRAPGEKILLERVHGLEGVQLRCGVGFDEIFCGNGGAERGEKLVGVGGRLVDDGIGMGGVNSGYYSRRRKLRSAGDMVLSTSVGVVGTRKYF